MVYIFRHLQSNAKNNKQHQETHRYAPTTLIFLILSSNNTLTHFCYLQHRYEILHMIKHNLTIIVCVLSIYICIYKFLVYNHRTIPVNHPDYIA